MKSPRRLAVWTTLCGTVVLTGWGAAGLAGFGSRGIENTGAPIEDSPATFVTAKSVIAEHVDEPKATAPVEDAVSVVVKDSVPVEAPYRSRTLSPSPIWGAAALLCPTLVRCRRPPRHPCGSRRWARLIRCSLIRCRTPPGRP